MSHPIPGPPAHPPHGPYGQTPGQAPYQPQWGQAHPQYAQQYPPQYAQPQPVYVANQPRRTVHGVGVVGTLCWWMVILMTCGLAYPLYSRAKRTSRHY